MALLVLGSVLAGCGSSLSAIVGSTSTTLGTSGSTGVTTTTVAPLSGEVAVAFPVVACNSVYGVPLAARGWRPSILLAPIPTALVGKVEFYTDGTHTLLGPDGWTCSQSAAAPGATGLVVFPSNDPDPPTTPTPPAGTQGIFATFATTGHSSGVSLVCPYFTIPAWQQSEANCTGAKPAGEQAAMPTPDVASITDPSDVTGSLPGSGGIQPVTGVVIFPQAVPAVTDGSSIDVAEESCSLSDPTLCPTIISDFEVREFPVPLVAGQ
jgi:hypothetical protein